MKIDTNYKIAIGVGVLALLFIAYKKGVFGSSESDDSGNSVADEETLKSSMPPKEETLKSKE